MRSAIVTVVLAFCATVSSFAAATDVAYDKKFAVRSTPEVWSTGSKICFAVENKNDECAAVTDLGEIKLREKSNTPPEVYQNYVESLTAEQKRIVNQYDKFFVRYLALDGDKQGRYIVQIFINVGPGTQAIYLYGNFTANDNAPATFEPMGYGESSSSNLSFLRSNQTDQDAIQIAQSVIQKWASSRLSGTTVPPKN